MQTSRYNVLRQFARRTLVLVLCLTALGSHAELALAEVMSSGSYTMQADSMNFGGIRSDSASYALEDTGGEVGTGDLQGTNNILHAGYQQSAVAVTPSTPTPTPTPSSPSTSSSGRLPLNVINFIATPSIRSMPISNQCASSDPPHSSRWTSLMER
jgi:hypothetical protein